MLFFFLSLNPSRSCKSQTSYFHLVLRPGHASDFGHPASGSALGDEVFHLVNRAKPCHHAWEEGAEPDCSSWTLLLSINAGLIGECIVQLPLLHAHLSCPHTGAWQWRPQMQNGYLAEGAQAKEEAVPCADGSCARICCCIQLSTGSGEGERQL